MTAVSEVSICNEALDALGAATISVLTDNSPNGKICNRRYETIRDSVLTDHLWNFASKRAELAQLAGDPVWTEDGMTVRYSKPSDYLRLGYISIKSATVKIEGNEILSNTAGLKIKYIFRQTDPMKYEPKFREALAAKIAAEIAYAVTKNRQLGIDLFKLYYDEKLPTAMAVDSQQGSPDPIQDDDVLISRLQGSSAISGNTGDQTWFPV